MPLTSTPESQPDTSELAIATDKVCFIIAKARAFDAKEGDADPDSGSNAIDDAMTDVLEDKPNDPVYRELVGFIRGLNQDEQINLVALAWLGRGTFDLSEWNEAIETAAAEHNNRTAQYLLGLPLLGDYLENGLDAFGLGCAEDAEKN
jgi:hypothetical protein